jgi:Cell division GTPase
LPDSTLHTSRTEGAQHETCNDRIRTGGGKVVDKFIEYDKRTGSEIVRAATAVNTAKADLMGLTHIPEDKRVLIGQSRVKGHGVGADNELGAEIAEEDIDEIQGAIDSIPVHEVDAFLVVAGLGGGTGSGGAPVLAKHLKRIYTEPVYGLGVLPGATRAASTRSTPPARSRRSSARWTT